MTLEQKIIAFKYMCGTGKMDKEIKIVAADLFELVSGYESGLREIRNLRADLDRLKGTKEEK